MYSVETCLVILLDPDLTEGVLHTASYGRPLWQSLRLNICVINHWQHQCTHADAWWLRGNGGTRVCEYSSFDGENKHLSSLHKFRVIFSPSTNHGDGLCIACKYIFTSYSYVVLYIYVDSPHRTGQRIHRLITLYPLNQDTATTFLCFILKCSDYRYATITIMLMAHYMRDKMQAALIVFYDRICMPSRAAVCHPHYFCLLYIQVVHITSGCSSCATKSMKHKSVILSR